MKITTNKKSKRQFVHGSVITINIYTYSINKTTFKSYVQITNTIICSCTIHL